MAELVGLDVVRVSAQKIGDGSSLVVASAELLQREYFAKASLRCERAAADEIGVEVAECPSWLPLASQQFAELDPNIVGLGACRVAP